MRRSIILSSMFIGYSIIFSAALIVYNIGLGKNTFIIFIALLSGTQLAIVFVLLCQDLMSEPLHFNKVLSEKEEKFLKDNDA